MELSIGDFESRLIYGFMKYELSGEDYDKQQWETAYKIAFVAVKVNRVLIKEERAHEIFKKEWANKKMRLYNAFCYAYISANIADWRKLNLTCRKCMQTTKFTPSAWNLYTNEKLDYIDICIERNYVVVKHLKASKQDDNGRLNYKVKMACVIGELPDIVILDRYPNLKPEYQITVSQEGGAHLVKCGEYAFKYNYAGTLKQCNKHNQSAFITYTAGPIIFTFLYFPFYPVAVKMQGQQYKWPGLYVSKPDPLTYDPSWIEEM